MKKSQKIAKYFGLMIFFHWQRNKNKLTNSQSTEYYEKDIN